jgi:SAM-dependent methyltransferase
MANLETLYRARFGETGLDKRRRVWEALCSGFFDGLVGDDKTVLDLACGYGEFINAVKATKKIAVDINPDARRFLDPGVIHYDTPATDLGAVAASSVDVVFTSNFLEHLRDKSECDKAFAEVHRVLRPGGRFILLGPNIHYAFKEYWDYYDHHIPLSHLSLAEGLTSAGYEVIKVVPRFLPYTMKSSTPTANWMILGYLSMPFLWPFVGKQFLVVAEKPESRIGRRDADND